MSISIFNFARFGALIITLASFASAVQGVEPKPQTSTRMEENTQLRASTLSGTAIRNLEGKQVATIHDVVLDTRTGAIRYAAVSYGGFLGVGDKLFAVPWKALEYGFDELSSKRFFVLDVTEADLKKAEGFNQEHWPDFADKRFTDKIDVIYRGRHRIGGTAVDVDIKGGKVNVDIQQK